MDMLRKLYNKVQQSSPGDSGFQSIDSDCHNRSRTFQGINNADKLAEQGFYYTGFEDIMKCVYCGLTITYKPDAEHSCPKTCCDTSFLPYNLKNIMIEDRMKTFKDWTGGTNPTLLAQSGFYYTQFEDAVICRFCNIGLYDWQQEDIPDEQHKKLSPDCPFMRNRHKTYEKPEPNHWINRTPEYTNMRNKHQRLSTFEDWPKHMTQSKIDMVDAGFFYTDRSDKSVCFFCDVRIHRWEKDDDPWVEHAYWQPRCPYVLKVMGKEFVDQVQNEGREAGKEYLKRLKKNENPSSLIKAMMCLLCEEKADMICDPCGHVVTCHSCSQNLFTCPKCGMKLKGMVKMYM